jgi:hypothetical protein
MCPGTKAYTQGKKCSQGKHKDKAQGIDRALALGRRELKGSAKLGHTHTHVLPGVLFHLMLPKIL